MIATVSRAPTNLPLERTSFVGRLRDVAEIERLVAEGERLITLVGPAGCGKTRLALRCAARLLASEGQALAGGVWFCDLTEARSRDFVVAAVSATLAAPLAQGSTSDAAALQLGHALAARPPMLLILDNFEQIVDEAGTTVAEWHAQAPDVTFLLTSRARVRLEGETLHEVGELGDEEAIDLFAERARKVLPSFDRRSDEAAIRELVRRLDGSPLAIELAAARAKVLPPRKLLDRLAARLDLLESKHRDTPARHVTLRTALDGSWDLLETWEKQALAQCSCFHGGFTLEAAEAVLAVDALPPRQRVLDVLEALADQSLIARDDAPAGEVRFRLLETIREYAGGKLRDDVPADAGVWQRHVDHYLADAEAWSLSSLAAWGAASAGNVAREIDNLTAIARRSELRSPVTLVRAALCLDAVLAARGPVNAHRDVLDKALEALDRGDSIAPELAARLLAVSANAHRLRGQLAEGRAQLARAGSLAARAVAEAALVQNVTAHLELDAGRLAAARAAASRALDLARACVDPRIQVIALLTLARVHVDAEELEEGRLRCDEALPLARRLVMPLVESGVQNLLGVIAARDGRLAAAEAHYEASTAIARELGDVYGEIRSAVNLADVHARRADRAGALARFERALAVSRRMGFRRVQGVIMSHLGLVEHEALELDAARASHEEALAIHREVGNVRSEAYGLEAAGLLALEDGRLDEARALLERSLSIATEHPMIAQVALSRAHLVAALALRGDLDEARRALVPARAAATSVGLPDPVTLTDLHEAIVWVAEARAIRASNADDPRLAAARRRLDDSAAFARGSLRCRIARRILERAIDAASTATPGTVPLSRRDGDEVASTRASLEVGTEGRWFRRGSSEPVDLSRRRSLRLLVARLARLRLDAPGTALSLDALFEAGWPGEHIAQAAAFRRVYTAIGMLRDFGMRDILVRRDDGYLLSPAVPLRPGNEKL